MKIFGDYHTHTVYSHGKGTIEDNVKSAIEKGLKDLVISDHGPGHFLFGVKKSNIIIMRREIDILQKKYPEINLMLGLEANIISVNGDIDVNSDEMKYLDKLLVGFHYGAFGKKLHDTYDLFLKTRMSKMSNSIKEKNKSLVTKAVVNALQRHKIDILTHPGDKTPVDIKPIAECAKKRGTLLEINSGHGHLTVEDATIACGVGANFIIDSDAHRSCDVGNFERAIKIAKEANIPIDRIYNAEK